jgi:hypothetical protein
MSHTPEPWTLDTTKKYYKPCIRHNGVIVCLLTQAGPGKTEEEETGNRALMVAAPTMYATLQWVLAWLTNTNAIDQSALAQRVINALRDAGMKPADLDAAAIALLKGCARA